MSTPFTRFTTLQSLATSSLFQRIWTFSKTKDQIISLPISSATGYGTMVFNAGQIDNEGFDVSLFAAPVKTNNLERCGRECKTK